LDQIAVVTESKIDDDLHYGAQALDEHYVRPRYPDARSEIDEAYDEEVAQDALNDAHNVVAFAQKSINNARTVSDDEPTADLG
jgi:HEPN domain-containing protein